MEKHCKYFFVVLFAFLLNTVLLAQHSAADSTSKSNINFFNEGGISLFITPNAITPVASYWFRMNVYEPQDHLSVSLSLPLSVGGSIGTYGGYFGLDLPFTADLNIGNRATKKIDFPLGLFVGGGYGINTTLGYGFNLSYGPLMHAGLRLTSPLSGRNLTFRFSYLYGIGGISPTSTIDVNPNVLGVGMFYGF